jgi:hypothetical protein
MAADETVVALGVKESMDGIVERLVDSGEAAIRYKARVYLLGEDPSLPELRWLQEEIRGCERVRRLLGERDASGRIPYHPYSKWYGAHWVLVMLAELEYPEGDEGLVPLREQVYEWLFSDGRAQAIKRYTLAGRTRMCASMEGNAIWALLKLGLADERVEKLVERLLVWQWPDGGWNCDKKREAHVSSFMETLIPLRGLALYGQLKEDERAQEVSREAAEVFLKRRLFKRLGDGTVIAEDFLKLRYPWYWHYDILAGLKVMAETGFIKDARCREGLELLASKRLLDGGFPAERKQYHVTEVPENGRSVVDWGGTSVRRMNPFVTVEALYALKIAERLTSVLPVPGSP